MRTSAAPSRLRHEPLAQRNSSQSPALAAGLRACGIRRSEAQARSAHAAFCAVRAGPGSAGCAAELRHRIGSGQDRRYGRWPAQRHARKLDRAHHRAGRFARRAIRFGEGIHRRGDCHQHVVHVGRVVSARRTQASRAGIQPGQRPSASGPALSGHDRDVGSLGGLRSRFRRRLGVH